MVGKIDFKNAYSEEMDVKNAYRLGDEGTKQFGRTSRGNEDVCKILKGTNRGRDNDPTGKKSVLGCRNKTPSLLGLLV